MSQYPFRFREHLLFGPVPYRIHFRIFSQFGQGRGIIQIETLLRQLIRIFKYDIPTDGLVLVLSHTPSFSFASS